MTAAATAAAAAAEAAAAAVRGRFIEFVIFIFVCDYSLQFLLLLIYTKIIELGAPPQGPPYYLKILCLFQLYIHIK